jgi:signal transduction histidine kinase
VRSLRAALRGVPALDVALAGVLLVVGQSQVWLGWSDGGVGSVPAGAHLARAALAVALTAPLVLRRVRPVAVLVAVCAAVVVQLVAVTPYLPLLPGLVPLLVADYSAAAFAARSRPGALLLALATEAVLYARIPAERVRGEVLFGLFVVVGTWLVGDLVRARWARAERAVGAARGLLAEQEAAAAVALDDERARIARELHDVIAHSVSVMGVQAGAARTVLGSDPDAAREALLQVEAAARDSVAELQRLLAVLRGTGHDDEPRTPQPGLADLPGLVARLRTAGLQVEVSVDPVPELPPGIDLTAFRIIQESLTNALKHAGTATRVLLHRVDGELRIEVRQDGPAVPVPRPAGGHGLVGMRERAQLYGGALEAGPGPDGGFVVRARLPVAAPGTAPTTEVAG